MLDYKQYWLPAKRILQIVTKRAILLTHPFFGNAPESLKMPSVAVLYPKTI